MDRYELPTAQVIQRDNIPFSTPEYYDHFFGELESSGLSKEAVAEIQNCFTLITFQDHLDIANRLIDEHIRDYPDQPICFIRIKSDYASPSELPSTSGDFMERVCMATAIQRGLQMKFEFIDPSIESETEPPVRAIYYLLDDVLYSGDQASNPNIQRLARNHNIRIYAAGSSHRANRKIQSKTGTTVTSAKRVPTLGEVMSDEVFNEFYDFISTDLDLAQRNPQSVKDFMMCITEFKVPDGLSFRPYSFRRLFTAIQNSNKTSQYGDPFALLQVERPKDLVLTNVTNFPRLSRF